MTDLEICAEAPTTDIACNLDKPQVDNPEMGNELVDLESIAPIAAISVSATVNEQLTSFKSEIQEMLSTSQAEGSKSIGDRVTKVNSLTVTLKG